MARLKPPPNPELSIADDRALPYYGSYINIKSNGDDTVSIEVGDRCVTTVRARIHIAVLATLLTAAQDEGFLSVLTRSGWDENVAKEALAR